MCHPLQIVLTVDTTLQNERLEVSAFISRRLTIRDRPLATQFRPIACEVRGVELEKINGEFETRFKVSVSMMGHSTSLQCSALTVIGALMQGS